MHANIPHLVIFKKQHSHAQSAPMLSVQFAHLPTFCGENCALEAVTKGYLPSFTGMWAPQ